MELLAPAGSFEAFKAAVENGADAVYLGGRLFNARQSATNFSLEEIAEAVKYAHVRGVRVYITLNILIADHEFKEVINYIHGLMECGIDAIIIQDIGLMHVCKEVFPELPLHASTQMTIHNTYGAKWYHEQGMERLVLAREMAIDEIKLIARSIPAELETFVHGALCISYSGQCLFSSMVGGRSGNRGRCAQPCRMSYKLVNQHDSELTNEEIGEHLLSPKDLNTAELLPKLDEAGITSLKIEGRMKRPEYVATVVRVYRNALNRMLSGDKFSILAQEKKDLAQIFNREFTTGYYLFNPGKNLMSYKRPNNRGTFLGRILKHDRNHAYIEIKLEDSLSIGDGIEVWVTKGGRNGFVINDMQVAGKKRDQAEKGEIVTLPYQGFARNGDRVFKTSDIRLQTLARESYLSGSTRRVGIEIKVTLKNNKPMIMHVEDKYGNKVEAIGTVPAQVAKTTATTPDMIKKQLERLGNTAYKIHQCNIDVDEGIMLPVSEINAVRREAINKLEELKLQNYRRYTVKDIHLYQKKYKDLEKSLGKYASAKTTNFAIAVSTFAGFKAAITAKPDLVYIGGEQFRQNTVLTKDELLKCVELTAKDNIKLVFSLPRIWHDHEKKYLSERIRVANDVGINAFQISTPAGLNFIKEIIPTAEIYADYFINAFNSYTLKKLTEQDIKTVTLSPELKLEQLKAIKGIDAHGECVIFGALPLMLSEHCVLGSTLGGRTETNKCNMSCKEGRYYLKDRLKFRFPVLTDMACRMHIYNAKVMNLLPNLNEIMNVRPSIVRVDLRIEQPETIRKVADYFGTAIKKLKAGKQVNYDEIQEELTKLYPHGFTKGHYFRGVVDTEE